MFKIFERFFEALYVQYFPVADHLIYIVLVLYKVAN